MEKIPYFVMHMTVVVAVFKTLFRTQAFKLQLSVANLSTDARNVNYTSAVFFHVFIMMKNQGMYCEAKTNLVILTAISISNLKLVL